MGINANKNYDRDRRFVRDGAHDLPINRIILANPCRQPDYFGFQEDYDDQREADYANYN